MADSLTCTNSFYRATLCVSSVFAVAARCPSVCQSRWCIVSRRLKIFLNFFLGPVAHDSSFYLNFQRNPFSGRKKWGGKIWRFSTEIAVYLGNGTG